MSCKPHADVYCSGGNRGGRRLVYLHCKQYSWSRRFSDSPCHRTGQVYPIVSIPKDVQLACSPSVPNLGSFYVPSWCRGVPPHILQHPADASLEDGQPLRLAVDAAGDMPLLFQWLRDGTPLPGECQPALEAAAIAAGDAGIYSCRVHVLLGHCSCRQVPASYVVPFGAGLFKETSQHDAGRSVHRR